VSLSGSQHYALAGLSTCLVIHNQDPTADYLLNCKIGTSPVTCNKNLSAVRLETTKVCFLTSYLTLCHLVLFFLFFSFLSLSGYSMICCWLLQMLLEPLNRLKQADAHLNMTQGVLEGVGT
jgi:hypothetical protein